MGGKCIGVSVTQTIFVADYPNDKVIITIGATSKITSVNLQTIHLGLRRRLVRHRLTR